MKKETYIFLLTGINKYLEVSEIIRETSSDTVYSAKDTDYIITIKDDLDGALEYLRLQDLQKKIVFLIAKHQDGGAGVSPEFLANNANENTTKATISGGVTTINKKSKNFSPNQDFILITKADHHHYLINGREVKPPRNFCFDDFFDVFSNFISTIKLGDSFSNIDDLNAYEKYKVLFTLLDADIDEKKLELLYARSTKWINETYCLEVFRQLRMRLKDLLNHEEIFNEDYNFLKSAPSEDYKKRTGDLIEEKKNKWKNGQTIFPKSKNKYNDEAIKVTVIDKINRKEIITYFSTEWVSPFLQYDFSAEAQCINIDDIIVSFALLALSNYQSDKEKDCESLTAEQDNFRDAVKKLIRKRFGPDDNNHQDLINGFKQIIINMSKIGYSKEQIINMINNLDPKIIENYKEYYNEDNDHSITK